MRRKARRRFYSVVVLGLIIFIATIGYVVSTILDQTRNTAVDMGERSAQAAVTEVNLFFRENNDVIEFVGTSVETAIDRRESNAQIKTLLTEATAGYRKSIQNSVNGFYGVVRGEFITADTVKLPKNYNYKTRSWYIDAMGLNPGETMMTQPYTDRVTGMQVISFIKRLKDGESIILFDIPLNLIDKMAKEIAKNEHVKIFFLDDKSTVVAGIHPKKGTNYLRGDGGEDKKKLAEAVYKSNETYHTEYNIGDENVMVYINALENNWRSVIVVDKKALYADAYTNASVLIVGSIVLLLILLPFLWYSIRKREQAEDDFYDLNAIGEIYVSITHIDLKTNSFREIRRYDKHENLIDDDKKDAAKTMKDIMLEAVTDEYLDIMLAFTELSDLKERLGERKTISREFVGRSLGWCRARFIAAEKSSEGELLSVIFTVSDINDAKREEDRLLKESRVDKLTGLFNRKAYEEIMEYYDNAPMEDDLVYITADVNGLKAVNDDLGHEAGDELIKASAECLRAVLRPHGHIFRTGGDEFFAIIHLAEDKIPALKEELAETCAAYRGRYVNEVSISCGFMPHAQKPELTIRELAKCADERMYADKARYYNTKGIDRRGQQEAYDAICKSYVKILLGNLTEDSFRVVQVDRREQDAEFGYFERLGAWMESFALTGHIHEDDAKTYLANTNLEYLKNYFKEGNTELVFRYRRKINGEFKLSLIEIVRAPKYTDDNMLVYLYVKQIEK